MMKAKSNSVLMVITSIMCLLPVLLALAIYPDLPEEIAVQWNSAGVPSNFIPRPLAAFGLPVLFLVVNLYSKLRLFHDPTRTGNSHSQALRGISIWSPPLLSLILVPVTLFMAAGAAFPLPFLASALTGCILILAGNYLPKCRQNYTIGIKLPWTLHDADNWNKTHRMAGRLWIIGGMLLLAGACLLPNSSFFGVSITVPVVVLMIAVPTLYSYYHAKRKQ